MYTQKSDLTKRAFLSIIMVTASFMISPAIASDLVCTGPQIGEIYINTNTGKVTKGAEETLTVVIAKENTHYGFVFKGKTNRFKAAVNRANGQIILNDACTPECWGGPIFGNCQTVKAKL